MFLFVWMRGTLPRVRIDQLMGFAWKWLLPASLLNLFVTAAAILVIDALKKWSLDEPHPGPRLVKGMALTLRRFFEPKATIMYPEVPADVAPKFRGRLQLLYDEYGTLKCETCFQCAQACPIECIDMGGMDTKGRFHVHWGPPETYGERREESALRRSGRPVPDPAYEHFAQFDIATVDDILEDFDHDPKQHAPDPRGDAGRVRLPAGRGPEADQPATGAWYAMIYGTASYYGHLRFEPPAADAQAEAGAAPSPSEALPRGPRRRPWRAAAAAGRTRWPCLHSTPDGLAGDPAGTGRRRRPADLDGAVQAGAFDGLSRPVRELGPEGTIAEVKASGLRGRGGAGHLTADKWQAAAETQAKSRYVVANGYGADPAASTDRTLIETDPYAVVEGVAIAAFSIGATEAIIAVRADGQRPRAGGGDRGRDGPELHRRGRARERAPGRDRGPPVQGAYMLGEETVLLKALEGKRGQPEQRPPHPAERGLWDAPTVVQNVQTLAAVPWILRHGADAFRRDRRWAAPGTDPRPAAGPERRGVAGGPAGTAASATSWRSRRAGQGRSRRSSSAARPAASCRRASWTRPYDCARARRRRPRRLRLRRRRRRPRLRRRPGPPADPLLRRRGVRQDDPVPDRPPAARRDRRARCGGPPPPMPTRWRTSAQDIVGRRACATTSAWRLIRSRPGCDTSVPNSTTTSSAAPAQPASAIPSR